MRCLFSAFMMVLKPAPSAPPIMLLAGTRQLSRNTLPTGDPAWPILRYGVPVDSPGAPRSTMNAETPFAPVVPGSVLAVIVNTSAIGALVM